MKSKGKLIALIVWCLIVVFCFIAARSFLSTVLLLGTAVLLLFCVVSVKKCGHTLQTELIMPQLICQGKKKSGKLYIRNTGAFPMFCVKGTICCSYAQADQNTDTQEAETKRQDFTCAVSPYQREEITVRINSAAVSDVHVWVEKLTVYDVLGLLQYSADVTALSAVVKVTEAPRQADERETFSADNAKAHLSSTTENEDRSAASSTTEHGQAEQGVRG